MTSGGAAAAAAAAPPMPWFGIDIGGTLAKLVYFEPADASEAAGGHGDSRELLARIHHYLTTNKAYGSTGLRDTHLQLDEAVIHGQRGSLHFIRFPSSQMHAFIELAKEKGMAQLHTTVCATGGGAYKYQEHVNRELRMRVDKCDEIDALVAGLQYLEASHPAQLFYYDSDDSGDSGDSGDADGEEERPRRRPCAAKLVYPYLVANIGSGVSILCVRGPRDYRRVSGTSLGGGTFLGLCCLLTDCQTFEEALELASRGSNRHVDKFVKDIYGGDYARFGLHGDLVASSFGNMNCPLRKGAASAEDLARTTLITITNNIGSLVRLCAVAERVQQVVFVGNFLRINSISMKLLSNAMTYWSNGKMRALFCRHEGYFGAVGCLTELMKAASPRAGTNAPAHD